MPDHSGDVTALLHAWTAGDLAARDRLVLVVYRDLRRRAVGYLRRERAGGALQPTALVHEAYCGWSTSVVSCGRTAVSFSGWRRR